MNRITLALLAIASVAIMNVAQAACRHSWTIGVYNHLPFQGFDSDGNPTGIEVDLIRQVATQMGCQVTFKDIPWQRQLNYAKTGEVDIVMGAGIREDRKAFLYFFSPYIYEPSVFVMLPQQQVQYPISSLDDVTKMNAEFKIAALIGASYSQAYADWIKKAPSRQHVDFVSTNEISMRLLLAKRVQAALFADPHEPYIVLRKMNIKPDIVVFPIDIERREDNYAYFTYSKHKFTQDDARAINERVVATIKSKAFAQDLRKYFSDSEIRVLLTH
jgi:ABC-type amino acid transport substrate-binding protein